jgi:two-component system response regulator AtoC
VHIPPLRDRREDIPLLAEALARSAAIRLGRRVTGVDADALRVLVEHDWPGNVRQLENALERAVLLARGSRVTRADLPADLAGASPSPAEAGLGGLPPELARLGEGEDLSVKRWSAVVERYLIGQALARTGGNRSQAARLLEISTKALLYKLRDYGLED